MTAFAAGPSSLFLQCRRHPQHERPPRAQRELLVPAHEAAVADVERVAEREVHRERPARHEAGEAGGERRDRVPRRRDVARVEPRLPRVRLRGGRDVRVPQRAAAVGLEAHAVEQAQRRDEGEGDAGRGVLAAHVVTRGLHGEEVPGPVGHARLGAGQPRVPLHHLERVEHAAAAAERAQVDVVVHDVDEARGLRRQLRPRDAHAELRVERRLHAEVRVPALEGARPLVEAVGEQVGRRRGAEAARHVEHQRHRLGDAVEHAGAAGDGREGAPLRGHSDARVAVGRERAVVVAGAGRRRPPSELRLLEQVDGGGARAAAGDQRLGAAVLEVARHAGDAERAADGAHAGVVQVREPGPVADEEAEVGHGGVGAGELAPEVLLVPGVELQPGAPPGEGPRELRGAAVCVDELEAGVAGVPHRVVEDLDPLVAPRVAHGRRAPRAAVAERPFGGEGAVVGVREHACGGAHAAAATQRDGAARAEAARRRFRRQRPVRAAHVVVVGGREAPAHEARHVDRVGHRRRDHVDHPAERVRAVEHARRPLDDLHPLGGGGLHVRGVVVPPRLRLGALPVVERHHAVVRHPADHRLSDPRGHAQAADARHLLERLAERRALRGAQLRALDDAGGLRRALRARGGGGRGHLHGGELYARGTHAQGQLGVARRHAHAARLGHEPDAREAHRVAPGGHGAEAEASVVGGNVAAPQLDDHDAHAGERHAGRVPDLPTENVRAALGGGGGGGERAEEQRARDEGEPAANSHLVSPHDVFSVS